MIHGNYFFARHSHGYLTTMTVADQQLIISHDAWDAEQIHDLTTARLSPPVGKTPLTILFANGDSFETPYDKNLIALFTTSHPSNPLSINAFTHLLESHGKLIALSLIATVSLLLFAYFFGIRMTAAYFAPKVPEQIVTQIDASVLAWFDDNLEPSQLRQKTKTDVTALANALPTQENITIHIYHSEFLGANAFALPGGSIVLTDELITTLQQDELLAVLLHEVGHIEANHSMEGLLHGAGISLLWFIWLGDLSGFMESLIIAAPTTLQQLSFNREAEYQADNIAVKHLQAMGISSGCLTTALKKITAGFDEPPEYLSTHPHTEKRIKDLEVSCYRL